MNHPSGEDLVLHYYGEAPGGGELEGHLAVCETCRAEYQGIQRLLNTMDVVSVPERSADYGAQVWHKIAGRVPRRRMWLGAWIAPRRWVLAASLVILVTAAFLAGRYVQKPAPPAAVNVAQTRERILLVAVGEHLERSQMVLAEIANTEPQHGKLDISYEQFTAQNLVAANRILRQTAARDGNIGMAALLDDLERVLMEVANSPREVSTQQWDDLRRQIRDGGILFKVRVFNTQVEERESAPTGGSQQGS